MRPPELLPVSPTSSRECVRFLRGSVAAELSSTYALTYPPSPEGAALARLREARGLTVRQAARLLCLRVVDLEALERGAATLKNPKHWRLFTTQLDRSRADHDEDEET